MKYSIGLSLLTIIQGINCFLLGPNDVALVGFGIILGLCVLSWIFEIGNRS